MDDCEYRNITTNTRQDVGVFEWKPFFRQLFVCSGIWANNFVFGLSIGAPAVLIPQIRNEMNSTAAVSDEMASWISSGSHMTSLFWIILLLVVASHYGRKLSFLIVAATSFAGFVIFYCSTNVLQILIGELMIGASLGAMSVISPMIVTEYTSPQYRGWFLTMKSASNYWGVWVANIIGTFTHWRYIGVLGIICSAFTLSACLWPESPDWLATKGLFDECAGAHRWLKGNSVRSQNELESRIASQEREFEDERSELLRERSLFRKMVVALRDRQFYKPLYLCAMTVLLLGFSGKSNSTIYSLTMIKAISSDDGTAYTGMLILDGLTVLSAYVGCGLTKLFKRRSFFLVTSFLSISFMLMVSLQLYLIKLGFISASNALSLVLLSGYSVTVSVGPVILASTIISELLPLKYKGVLLLLVALIGNLFIFVFLKISPFIFRVLGMHGTFLLYGLPSLLLLSLLYRQLPETRNKTLQEIEKCFKPD